MACFSKEQSLENEWSVEDVMKGVSHTGVSISISPIPSLPSFMVAFPVGERLHTVQISVLENGIINLEVDDNLKHRACELIDKAGISVGIEFLRKEL